MAEDVIRRLAGFRAEHAPVTTCYLDVDGRRYLRHQDLEHEVELLLRTARAQANGDHSVARDLSRIEEYVRGGFDRSRTRGLAIFACHAHELWEVYPLPVPVPNRIVINHMPAVSQLEAVVEEAEAFGVLLADRQRARLFVFELDELVEYSEVLDALPREYDSRGEKERGDVSTHVAALRHQHLRKAADAVWQVFNEQRFAHLVIGAPEDIAGELQKALHPYLRDRLCGRLAVSVGASVDEITSAVMDVEQRVERQKEAEDVQRLRAAVATGRRGVAGLPAVFDALAERRIERLLVSQGYVEAGWRCDDCGTLALVGRRCPRCQGEMLAVDDVVEEAVEEALGQSCRVEICVGNADLDVLGRVGALLRY
jgi:peptide subunit release factor 1 (eRF1)